MYEEFIKHKVYLENVSPRTVEWYRDSLKGLGTEEPTQADVDRFIINMREKGLSIYTCNNRIYAVRSYLKWKGIDLVVKPFRNPVLALPEYTPQHLKVLRTFKPKTFIDRRLHCIYSLLMDTGIRIEECLKIKLTDVDLDNLLVKIHGKGARERIIPFSPEMRKILYRWILLLQKRCSYKLLFPTRTGTMMHRRNTLRDFKNLCKRLGFTPPKRSLHAFRHTYASDYIRQGGNPFCLQRQLGHSTPAMTNKYVILGSADLRDGHKTLL